MSTTIYDIRNDEEATIIQAIEDNDYGTLFKIATQYAGSDDEYAHDLRQIAIRARENVWAYDEANNN